jgi:predicted DNA-binding transcriptional regulator YafY
MCRFFKHIRSSFEQSKDKAMKQQWPLRWDLLLRYRLIEVISLWEGRLTTNHLCNSFGIGRQQASKDINNYLSDIAPGNLQYDKQLKGYKPSSKFQPKLTAGTADEYLHILSRNQDISHSFEGLDLQLAHTELMPIPSRNIQPEILRSIVRAAREEKRIEIGYTSLNSPTIEERIIEPHTLVFTGLRWHVRAYCEKNRDFRDFVLSRFRGQAEILDSALISASEDSQWHQTVTINIKPDPRLTSEQKKIIAEDYGMKRGLLKINTRATLVEYTLQALNIDPRKIEPKPEAQQIIISNLREIENHLF